MNSDAAKEVRWMTMMIGKFQINILIVLIRYGLDIFMVYMQTAYLDSWDIGIDVFALGG